MDEGSLSSPVHFPLLSHNLPFADYPTTYHLQTISFVDMTSHGTLPELLSGLKHEVLLPLFLWERRERLRGQ